MQAEARALQALQPEVAAADARASAAEKALSEASERGNAALAWAHGRVESVTDAYEARLAAALSAQEAHAMTRRWRGVKRRRLDWRWRRHKLRWKRLLRLRIIAGIRSWWGHAGSDSRADTAVG